MLPLPYLKFTLKRKTLLLTLVYLLSLIFATKAFCFDFSFESLFGNKKNQEVQESDTEGSEQASQKKLKISSSSENDLYTLLVAELAAYRNQPELAMSDYLEVANKTQNPEVAKAATEWAIEFQDPGYAIKASEIWAKNADNDLQAQLVASTLMIGQSINRAIPYLSRAIEINKQDIGQQLVSIQSRLTPQSADHLKMALIKIATDQSDNPYANLAAAQSSAQEEDVTNAKRFVDVALKINPGLTAALELKARLIRYESKTDATALKYLDERVKAFPNNSELRLFYARALQDANLNKEAIFHLKKLTDDQEYGGQALLYLGELYFKDGNFKGSKESWEKAAKSYSEVKDNAYYLLGQLAELSEKPDEALNWYERIYSGPFNVPATLREVDILKKQRNYQKAITELHHANATTQDEQKQLIISEVNLLAENKQLNDAYNLIDDTLAKLPEDEDLLLSHGNIAIQLRLYPTAEKDLRNILKKNPNNADVLNTLGYLLSLQKERLSEARAYAEQALALSPNNPEFLDNLGWINYKMGDAKLALTNLNRPLY